MLSPTSAALIRHPRRRASSASVSGLSSERPLSSPQLRVAVRAYRRGCDNIRGVGPCRMDPRAAVAEGRVRARIRGCRRLPPAGGPHGCRRHRGRAGSSGSALQGGSRAGRASDGAHGPVAGGGGGASTGIRIGGRSTPGRSKGSGRSSTWPGRGSATGGGTRPTRPRSRTAGARGTSLLAETLAKLNKAPKVLVSGSAVGYYGDRGDEVLTESSRPGSDFLAEVCTAWEAAATPAKEAGIRVATSGRASCWPARGECCPRC